MYLDSFLLLIFILDLRVLFLFYENCNYASIILFSNIS